MTSIISVGATITAASPSEERSPSRREMAGSEPSRDRASRRRRTGRRGRGGGSGCSLSEASTIWGRRRATATTQAATPKRELARARERHGLGGRRRDAARLPSRSAAPGASSRLRRSAESVVPARPGVAGERDELQEEGEKAEREDAARRCCRRGCSRWCRAAGSRSGAEPRALPRRTRCRSARSRRRGSARPSRCGRRVRSFGRRLARAGGRGTRAPRRRRVSIR